jgi:hypothetical protein
LKIGFDDKSTGSNEKFKMEIKAIYSQHVDVVEEMVWKAKIYNQSYQNSLRAAFLKYHPSPADFNRFILGNYTNPKDIHKRPLSKFVQDIARQLKLIK